MRHDKTIIVTGVASGIGAATAELVASQGAKVISVGIHRPVKTVGEYIHADPADKASIDRLLPAMGLFVGLVRGLGQTPGAD